MDEQSKARVCGRVLAGVVGSTIGAVAGSNPGEGMDVCIVLHSKDKRQNAGQ